ncbi:hypothetical protein [Paremcibacter congregatus]|uniref:hypothetical protein n=1 Tax=Paremcibacter congregatus TaxID=2043170 RepID=UPI003A8F5868
MMRTLFAFLFLTTFDLIAAQAETTSEYAIFGFTLGMSVEEVQKQAERLDLDLLHHSKAPTEDQAKALQEGKTILPSDYQLTHSLRFENEEADVTVRFNAEDGVSTVKLIEWVSKDDVDQDFAEMLTDKYGEPITSGHKALIWGDGKPLPLRTSPSLELREKTITAMVGRTEATVLLLRAPLQ